ncbi:MAG: radical SAM protein [Nitrospinales bacterium]
MPAGYLQLSPGELDARADAAYAMYGECGVCPHTCGVDRTRGETGFCGQGDRLLISSCVQHFGEEIPLTGTCGVGNIFVASCNMRCDYCQNHLISQERLGQEQSYAAVAGEMLRLQGLGVHFIGWVSPSHVVPGLLKSLARARRKGLRLPIIYNTSAFDSLSSLKLLEGVVDIYLPDLKYADDAAARQFSHVKNYVERSREAALEMFRQVGPLTRDATGLARRGLIVRHLVLPNKLAGTWETLCFLALELSPKIPLSLMGQYQPVHRASVNPLLSRAITLHEYEEAVEMAQGLGFETIFIQDLRNDLHNLPDFRSAADPFPMRKAHNFSGMKV